MFIHSYHTHTPDLSCQTPAHYATLLAATQTQK